MKNILVKSQAISILLISLSSIICGCGSREDLVRIQEFSSLSNQVADGFPKIAYDFYSSCLRAAQYEALVPSNRAGIESIIKNIKKCKEELKLQDLTSRLIQANNVLVAYMDALGNLASDRVIDYQPNIAQLQQGVSGLSNVEPENRDRVNLGINIASEILQASTNRYRRGKLKQVILSTDDSLQKYIQGIKLIITKIYINTYLLNEEDKINQYYADYMSNIFTNTTDKDTVSSTERFMDLNNQWAQSIDSVEQKISLANKYVSLLENIAQSHRALSQMFSQDKEPSSKEISEMVDKNTKAAQAFVQQLNHVGVSK